MFNFIFSVIFIIGSIIFFFEHQFYMFIILFFVSSYFFIQFLKDVNILIPNEPKKENDNLIKNIKEDIPIKKHANSHTFIVDGVQSVNDENISIQKLLDEAYKDYLYYEDIRYEELKNSEIEYGWLIKECNVYGTNNIYFELESTHSNKEKIKVILKDFGHIGYVPEESIEIVKKALNNDYNTFTEILGGKYKYRDEISGKIKIKKNTYGFEILITY